MVADLDTGDHMEDNASLVEDIYTSVAPHQELASPGGIISRPTPVPTLDTGTDAMASARLAHSETVKQRRRHHMESDLDPWLYIPQGVFGCYVVYKLIKYCATDELPQEASPGDSTHASTRNPRCIALASNDACGEDHSTIDSQDHRPQTKPLASQRPPPVLDYSKVSWHGNQPVKRQPRSGPKAKAKK